MAPPVPSLMRQVAVACGQVHGLVSRSPQSPQLCGQRQMLSRCSIYMILFSSIVSTRSADIPLFALRGAFLVKTKGQRNTVLVRVFRIVLCAGCFKYCSFSDVIDIFLFHSCVRLNTQGFGLYPWRKGGVYSVITHPEKRQWVLLCASYKLTWNGLQ